MNENYHKNKMFWNEVQRLRKKGIENSIVQCWLERIGLGIDGRSMLKREKDREA